MHGFNLYNYFLENHVSVDRFDCFIDDAREAKFISGTSGSSPSNKAVGGDKALNKLSSMVDLLMKEQRNLKSKLKEQEEVIAHLSVHRRKNEP